MSIELDRPQTCVGHTDGVEHDGSTPGSDRKDARSGVIDGLLVVATGILLVAVGYARARESLSFASPLFWAGQILIFAYVVFHVLKRSIAPRDREFLVILYAVAQSLIRWAYSPVMFQWFDELQHLRSLLNVLSSHHLFHTNFSLPISPRYPGMENVTAELAQVLPATPFAAAVLAASASHVLLAAALLLFFREVSQVQRVACLGVLLYLLSPQIHYFDTSFVYENVALPFLVLSVFFAIRFAIHQRGRTQNFVGLLACVAIAVVTHHVTALATLAVLAGVALTSSLLPDTRHLAKPLAICAAAGAVIDGCWVVFAAPETREYLGDVGPQILNGLSQFGQAQGKAKLPTSLPTPLIDHLCNPGGVALMLILLAASIRMASTLPPLPRLLVWMAPPLYASMILIRLFVGSNANGEHPDGAELAIRSLTYSSLFTALAVAVVLDRLAGTAARRVGPVRMPSGFVSATAIAVVLLLHSTTTGLPQWWQRLPGPFRADSFVSGIDVVGTSRAEWAATNLQAGSRYFGDITSMALLSALSQLDPVSNPGSLYDTSRLIPEDSALIGGLLATYLDVDTRMTQQAPVTRYFFKADVMMGEREAPIYKSSLDKFDDLAGISRIYDSGYDHFYDLRGMQDIYGN
ncbi:glycosyltransferase family 39 protein [Mycobacterium cookii]|uniref:glycosyltransferase family 39 protein n=1 Tax=Mycobacterium cookii TaxID=1775 RepID=UPI0013D69F22|nr:glycosyltransferase family 39 protein [Mycobacterium cookii]MCV7331814.1 glycosyltransferase family 39 protein [Mycobacterium cookii]